MCYCWATEPRAVGHSGCHCRHLREAAVLAGLEGSGATERAGDSGLAASRKRILSATPEAVTWGWVALTLGGAVRWSHGNSIEFMRMTISAN